MRIRLVIATATMAALLPISPVAQAQGATGELTWGIRSSFNNYTGGASELRDGAERKGNAFSFPLVSQSYNAAEDRTEAQFRGEVVYKKYCRDNGSCDLDLSMKNPKIVIDDDGSYIEATVSSKQYNKNETYAPATPVRIANLFTPSAGFKSDNGRIEWSEIPTSLTEEGNKMFSEFYTVGEGLDPVNFSYVGDGARPKTDEQGLRVADQKWTSPKAYTDATHTLHNVGSSVLVTVAGSGLYLLDAELKQIAMVDASLHKNGVGAFDSAAGVYYFTENDSKVLKAVDVTPTSLGTVREVGTAPAVIRAIGYNNYTNKVAVISQNTSGDDKSAHMSVVEPGGLRNVALPSTAELIGSEIDKYSDTIYTPTYNFGSGSLVEMLPMPDGTFILNPSADVTPAGENTSIKDLLVSIDPVGPEPAKFMAGSKHGTNRYLKNIATNGTDVIRWVMNGSAEHSHVQVLRYENRDVVEVTPITTGTFAGIAGLNWDKDNQPVLLDGSTGSLKWFNTPDKSIVLPNGRETFNKDHGQFIARADGSFYVQTLDESNDDHVEKFVLVRLYNPAQTPPPVSPGNDEERLKQLRIARAEDAVLKATEAYKNAATEQEKAEALRVLEEARKELAEAKGEPYTPLPAEPKPTSEPTSTTEPKPTSEPAPTTEPKPTSEPAPTTEPKPTSEPAPTTEPDKGSNDRSSNSSNNSSSTAGIIAAVIAIVAAIGAALFPHIRPFLKF